MCCAKKHVVRTKRRVKWNDNSSDKSLGDFTFPSCSSWLQHQSHFDANMRNLLSAIEGINGLIMLTHNNSSSTFFHVCKPINTFSIKIYSSICCSLFEEWKSERERKRNNALLNTAKSLQAEGKNRFGGAWNILIIIIRSMEIQLLFWTELVSMFMRINNGEFALISERKIHCLRKESP